MQQAFVAEFSYPRAGFRPKTLGLCQPPWLRVYYVFVDVAIRVRFFVGGLYYLDTSVGFRAHAPTNDRASAPRTCRETGSGADPLMLPVEKSQSGTCVQKETDTASFFSVGGKIFLGMQTTMNDLSVVMRSM